MFGSVKMDAKMGHQGTAIRALGSQFQVTEVFLWDDASGGISKSLIRHDSSVDDDSAGYASSPVSGSRIDLIMDDDASAEDLELAKQMGVLGLPTSFKTNKEQRRYTPTVDKRKGILAKSTFVHKSTGVQIPEVAGQCEVVDTILSQVSNDSRKMSLSHITVEVEDDESHCEADLIFNKVVLSDSEPNNQDAGIVEEIVKKQLCTELMDLIIANSTVSDCNPSRTTSVENAVENVGSVYHQDEKHSCEEGIDIHLGDTSNLCCVTESDETCIDSELSSCFADRSRFGDNGEWGVFWDAFYMRNYFYNFHTQESTWYPPPGLEKSALSFTSSKVNTDMAEDGTNLSFAWDENNYWDALKVTASFQEIQNDEVSGQTFQQVMSGVDFATETVNSDMDLLPLSSGSSKNLDEHVEPKSCPETSCSVRDLCTASFCSSDTMDHADRLTRSSNEMGGQGKLRSVSQQADNMPTSDYLHSPHCVMNCNRKKKVKRIKSNQKILSAENEDYSLPGTIEGLSSYLVKYWYQRYLLFSKFDHGVKMDEEGWFSVTPEAIARHHASRCGCGTVIDCFTGVGGNAIQFAMKSNHVIAIDIDAQKVDYAQHNAKIYGVRNNIDFIKGDFFIIASHLKADTVFMSPPWGGPDYAKVQTYDIQSMLKPHDGHFLFKTGMKIASTIVMFLPRNVDLNQLAELSLSVDPPWKLEVEKNYLNGKLKGITAYFWHPSNKRQEIPSDPGL